MRLTSRKTRARKQVLATLALFVALVVATGGAYQLSLQSYLHHNPDNTVSDFLYGENK